ncbi:hypothetical protein AAW14_02165 [Streptomyces hygroscopicus]|uniref:PRC-barrel domain-containing protein n=1 Tax=Streptomyces hygroscopicus TaxID=1912 RepID=UPI00223F8A60|nr:PRC-barrel domain-containing protein [Streptomyces hygroscopicus]MCW7940836.1 hypothetical protein [Streptomyces hygroscopicus]
MTSYAQARGLPVVTLGDAREIGELTSLALDAVAGRLTHVLVSGRGRKETAVAWDALHAVGPDAVLVEPDFRPESVPPGPRHEALGSRVLSEDGAEHGAVQDLVFDPSTGRIETVVTTLGEVRGDRLLGLGDFALVVRAD